MEFYQEVSVLRLKLLKDVYWMGKKEPVKQSITLNTYKKLEELEDSFMGKYIKCISADRIYNWQSVDFVFDQWIYSIKKAEEKNIYIF